MEFKSEEYEFRYGNPSIEVFQVKLEHEKTDSPESLSLCIVDIPQTVSICDFSQFVSSHLYSIRRAQVLVPDFVTNTSSYALLLSFHSKDGRQMFFEEFNNKPYNSLEPSKCIIQKVSSFEYDASGENCPVCLEDFVQSNEAVIKILCTHMFHIQCISKCRDGPCPVCRYTVFPDFPCLCESCDSTDDLWICLICGHVGCGRYHEAHAQKHFSVSGHTYAMDIQSRKVWDYTGDDFVYRIVQNKADGELVQFEKGGFSSELIGLKLEKLHNEFNYLMTEQMREQRYNFEKEMHFLVETKEAEIEKEEDELKEMLSNDGSLRNEVEFLRERLKRCETETEEYCKEIESLEKEKSHEEKKNETLRSLQKAMENSLKRIRANHFSQMEQMRQAHLAKVESIEEEKRDIEFFIKTHKSIQKSPQKQEITEGKAFYIDQEPFSKTSRRKKKK